jgi:excisionase family DNA binding protein
MAGNLDNPTTRGAATALGCSERQIRRLLSSGKLKAEGSGNERRITAASIDAYRAQRRFSDLSADMSSPSEADLGYRRAVQKLTKSLPALSQIGATARRLGIPEPLLRREIESRAVPSVAIGEHLMVPRFWLVEKLAQAQGFSRNGR